MTKGRGGLLDTDVPIGWGAELAAWWVSLQPAERRSGVGIEGLSTPSANMDWSKLSAATGYKGPFLIVWCMMHWAKTLDDVPLLKAMAEDMASAFKAMRAARKPTGNGGGGAGSKREGAAAATTDQRPRKQRKPDGV